MTQTSADVSMAAVAKSNAEREGQSSDLLDKVREEMRRAVGFENDEKLRESRLTALRYVKGDMTKDVASLPNRSKAVSSDVSDAIESMLPDLVEIFVGGDDVVSFQPETQQDEDAAEQETDYLTKVLFQDNPGFSNIETALRDALLMKCGIFTWDWCEDLSYEDEKFTGKNIVEMQAAQQDGEISEVQKEPLGEPTIDPLTQQVTQPEQTYSFTITRTKDRSNAKYWPVPPDDFAYSADTVEISESTYTGLRLRPRVQDLIAEGYDEKAVRSLPTYSETNSETQRARDQAGEHTSPTGDGDIPDDDLRQIEVRKHHIRILGDDGKLEYWEVLTDRLATVEIDRVKVPCPPYAVGTPYRNAHRLIGRSLADLMLEIQRIKTALIRLVLDQGYFANNQRVEISDADSNDYTLSDLMRNEPGMPVRSKTGKALSPLEAGALNFDPMATIEFISTVGEMRSGVYRAAQGLNPDALHDTASGAMALLSAAQKRTRMVARVLAETLIKPLYLGVHGLIRENSQASRIVQLRGKWVPVDPTKWHERTAMTVEVGLGAAGKDMEIAAMTQIGGLQKAIIEGGLVNIVGPTQIYNSATDLTKKLGVKDPQRYFADPSQSPPPPPQPNPQMAKIQADAQAKQASLQSEEQLTTLKANNEMVIAKYKADLDAQARIQSAQSQAAVTQQQQQLEHERMMAQQANEMQLEQIKIASQERIAIETARIKNEGLIAAAEAKGNAALAQAELTRQDSHETTVGA